MGEKHHIDWIQLRLREGPLQNQLASHEEQTLGALEVLMEMLLAGVDSRYASTARLTALARTQPGWTPTMGLQEVVSLAERAEGGRGASKESLWVYRMSGRFTLTRPPFRRHLHSDELPLHEVEAHARATFDWLVCLVHSLEPSGSWRRVGAGLYEASRADERELRSVLHGAAQPYGTQFATAMERQLPIAQLVRTYTALSGLLAA